jgi:hypothetical protein
LEHHHALFSTNTTNTTNEGKRGCNHHQYHHRQGESSKWQAKKKWRMFSVNPLAIGGNNKHCGEHLWLRL